MSGHVVRRGGECEKQGKETGRERKGEFLEMGEGNSCQRERERWIEREGERLEKKMCHKRHY